MNSLLEYIGDFMGKPRMTRRDKWLTPPRKCVARYWAFKDMINIAAKKQKFVLGDCFEVVFWVQMPKSWSKKKKNGHRLFPCRGAGDLDNYLKALQDALLPEDKTVWWVVAKKIWADENKIQVKNLVF